MAVFNKITYASLQGAKRLEAEYYHPNYMSLMTQLRKKSASPLGRLAAFVTDGIHASIDYDSSSGIRLISAQSVKENRFDLSAETFISAEQHEKNLRTSLQVGDVIVSSVGTIGNVAVVTKEMLPCNADRHVGIVRTNPTRLNPYFLAVFLNSKYGKFQTLREATGNVQLNLFIDKIKGLVIPVVINANLVAEFAQKAERLFSKSKDFYYQAEQLLLSELGLQDSKPKHQLTFVRNYSDISRARRLDAEHFQPKYDELLSIIRANAKYYRHLKDFRTFNARGSQPSYLEGGALRVINSRHILEQHLDYDNFERTDSRYWDMQRESRVVKHDILIYTTGANVGRTNIYLENEKALASNHVNILRVRDENQIYVGFVLNSIIGRLQTRKLVTGTAQAELYPADIDRFLIPFIAIEQQEEISALIQQSHTAQREAKALLEKAKRAVEIAIEESEERAIELIG